ncbi:transporter [Duganella sp. FT80W]|uniref:Transporter n=1 Tax=Duganella guangzhouensis TaxID=2666084 RepID=A0A6I2LB01_9BURK|nr:transporter [Duganella guangzhouensis]MRW94307.1 transporter [Duganella guangzhouensis]
MRSIWIATLLIPPLLAQAADEKDQIITDRPDFVESSNVVGAGRFQIETSVAMDRNKANGIKERSYSTPTLLRFGLSDNLEARIETDGRMRVITDDLNTGTHSTENGYADVSLGVKWHVADEQGARPSMGILAHVDLDSGSGPFRAAGRGGSLRLAAEWELPDEMGLGIMPGIAWQHNDNGERYTSGIFGIVLGKNWSERCRTFIEYSAPQIARSGNGGMVTTFDVGASYLLTDTMQVDTALSRGLNKNTPDWSWTVGLSLKF